MTRLARIAACCLLAAAVARAGEVIDAIVAVVNRVPVLHSQWDAAVRFEALEEGRSLGRVDAELRRAALERLIDRTLIDQQMRAARFSTPDAAELTRAFAAWREQVAPGLSDGAWTRRLAEYGLSASDV